MGTITIYVDEQKTIYRDYSCIPNNYYIGDDGWFIRQRTGNSWIDDQEFYDVKILSKNSQSCTIVGLAGNYDPYDITSTELHCKGTRQSIGDYEEMVWTIEVKSYGFLEVEASPAGGSITSGSKVTLTAKCNGSTVSGSDIYYTLDGSVPTKNSSKYTSAGITINNSCRLKAKAFNTGYDHIYIGDWYYTVKTLVTEIDLNATSVSLSTNGANSTMQLTATVSPSNATDKSVTWTSSNTTVATVSSSGLVSAISYGTAKITCKANDGSGVSATCTVDVHGPLVAEINATNFPDANFRNYLLSQSYGSDGKLTEDEVKNITKIDVIDKEISSLKGIEFFKALTELNCHINKLTSLDVSKNVELKSLSCGSNQLYTLDVSNNSILSELRCGGNQLTSITLPQSIPLKFLAIPGNKIKGDAMDAIIKILPTNTTSTEYELLVINLDDGNKGNVFTKAQAEAAKAKGWTPKCWSETEKKWLEYEGSDVILVENITLNNSSVTLEESKTHQLTATVTPSNATDKSVTWSSSNTSVATVSSSGLVTAKSTGTATITCKANDGSGKSASCKVTVESTPTNPDIYITSIQSGNADLTSLTPNDKLSLTATFMNYGATATVSTRLWIFDQDMQTVVYSNSQTSTFYGNSLTTVSMDYALTDIPAGKYFASILYYDEWEMNTWLYASKYLVEIDIVDSSPISKGDVNEDGKVNGTDLVALTNIILGKNAQKASADVNGDGKVNGTDYVALANIILGKSAASRSLDTDIAVSGTATLHVEPVAIKAGETRELTVNLANPNDELTLLQFDLLLPEGLYINKVGDEPSVSMGSRTSGNSHQLSAYADGQRVRCLLASPANELISGTEGAVVRLTVTAAEDICGGSLLLSNAIGVSPCEQEVIMPSQRYGLTESATGVAGVKNAEESSEVYSLTGQRQVKMKRGINLVNGKKIIKK